MNNNRKILCGAAALLVSAGFFGASFLISELSDHINRLGNGNRSVRSMPPRNTRQNINNMAA